MNVDRGNGNSSSAADLVEHSLRFAWSAVDSASARVPSLRSRVRVEPDLDLRNLLWRCELELGVVWPADWPAAVLERQHALALARFALTHRTLVLLLSTPVTTSDEMRATLAGHAVADIYAAVSLAQRMEPSAGRVLTFSTHSSTWPPGARDDAATLATWLATAGAATWDMRAQPGGWRLLRSQAASADLPRVCEVRNSAEHVTLETRISLQHSNLAASRSALAVYLLQQAARHPVRFGLAAADPDPAAVLQVRLAWAGLTAGQIAAGLDALSIAYDDSRREVQVLHEQPVEGLTLFLNSELGPEETQLQNPTGASRT